MKPQNANLATCQRCPLRAAPPGNGAWPACSRDGRTIIEHAKAADCPAGRYAPPATRLTSALRLRLEESSSKSVPPPPTWREKGPRLWAALHTRPRLWTGARAEREWLAWLDAEIGCGACRDHWRGLLKTMPPDLSSPEAYFAWGVAAHNQVSRRLGKPELLIDEAAARWGFVSGPSYSKAVPGSS